MDAERLKATELLIERLHADYPTRGFKISPSIDFVYQANAGVSVVAKQSIKKNDILLVIPDAVRLYDKAVLPSSFVKKLRRKIEYQPYLTPSDYSLVVAIMKVLGRKAYKDRNDDIFSRQASTWPSEPSIKDSNLFYWDVASVQKVWNRSGLFNFFEEVRANVDSTFNNIIYPILKNNLDDYIDESLPSNQGTATTRKDKLYNTFLYSFALAYSRAHEGQDNDGPNGELVPLAELFNGHSDKIDEPIKKGKKNNEKSVINVHMVSGKWPFLRGSVFRDDCNLPCSAVFAVRDIDEGEELIISYGDVSATGFAFKYGMIPMDLIKHHNIMSDVSIFPDPKLIPSDKMRRKCLEKADFPLNELKHNKKLALGHFGWRTDSVEHYKNGYNNEVIGSMRHFIIIGSCELMADELQRNYSLGKLRGALYDCEAFPRLYDLFDYNIEILGGNATSADDAAKASSPDTPSWEKCCLLARIAYRESLLMWQRAVALKAKEAFGTAPMIALQYGWEMPNSDVMPSFKGCQICGRSYPELKCTKCKNVGRVVQYCCRGHQVLDWKEHKAVCGK
mmetsp:Transcript_17530/g.24862  ORF Transcript_17530/g.24862 Transcript_17530/m.24862 type:complete len:563 (+) Transcript_17530:63-1751(+)